jgi:predicted anti-sigma-YlaC factor YlaD
MHKGDGRDRTLWGAPPPLRVAGPGARRCWAPVALALTLLALAACSPTTMAVNALGDAMSEGGGAFASDNDPDLIREALPFGLKTYESLLEVSPEHEGLLLAAARGFTVYAYLLQGQADLLDASDLQRARHLRARARNLYLRGRDYALKALELRHAGFAAAIRQDARRKGALAGTDKADVPYLYWGGAAWAGALSAAKDDLALLAELPIAAEMVRRVLTLDEAYERGSAHDFFIAYEGGRPGGDHAKAREHFRAAVKLSGGLRASTYVTLAEVVSVGEQNLAEFRRLLASAEAIDINREPDLRLANVIAQRRAQWLESRTDELFLVTEGERKP